MTNWFVSYVQLYCPSSVCLHSHSCISWSIFAKSGTEVTTLKSKNQYTKLRVSIIMNSATGQIPHSTECISSIIAIILKQNFTTTCTSLKEDTTVHSICRKNEIQQNVEMLKCSYFCDFFVLLQNQSPRLWLLTKRDQQVTQSHSNVKHVSIKTASLSCSKPLCWTLNTADQQLKHSQCNMQTHF